MQGWPNVVKPYTHTKLNINVSWSSEWACVKQINNWQISILEIERAACWLGEHAGRPRSYLGRSERGREGEGEGGSALEAHLGPVGRGSTISVGKLVGALFSYNNEEMLVWLWIQQMESSLVSVTYCCMTTAPRTQWLKTAMIGYFSQFMVCLGLLLWLHAARAWGPLGLSLSACCQGPSAVLHWVSHPRRT